MNKINFSEFTYCKAINIIVMRIYSHKRRLIIIIQINPAIDYHLSRITHANVLASKSPLISKK